MELRTCPGGPTSEEVASIALQKLGAGEVFLDVGCGTGLVSILASERFEEVFAVDRRESAVDTTEENFDRFGVGGSVIEGEAPEVLEGLPRPDAAFVGGSRNLGQVIEFLGGARIVVACARTRTFNRARAKMEDLEILEESLMVQMSRGYELEGSTAFEGENPVFLVVGGAC